MQELRHNYRRGLDKIDVRNLVFVDEAGVNLALTRLYARAMGGERASDSRPRNAGENVSLIGALSLDGLIAPMTLRGSVNTTAFLTYVTQVLVPQLWETDVTFKNEGSQQMRFSMIPTDNPIQGCPH